MVYDPVIEGRRYEFSVSGLLYKRNLLFYDHQTDSLWSQLLSQAVTGPMTGARLKAISAEDTTWKEWKAQHPHTRALSFVTGYQRDYKHDPYAAYPLSRDPALLVAVPGVIRIYPFPELKKAALVERGMAILEQIGDRQIRIVFDPHRKTARVEGEDAPTVTWFVAFLDDLKNFYPEAEIYRTRQKR